MLHKLASHSLIAIRRKSIEVRWKACEKPPIFVFFSQCLDLNRRAGSESAHNPASFHIHHFVNANSAKILALEIVVLKCEGIYSKNMKTVLIFGIAADYCRLWLCT